MFIRQRVSLLASDCDRYICGLPRNVVAKMLVDGLVAIEAKNKQGAVVSVRLTGKRTVFDARPGSYNIRREHVPVGHNYGLSGGVVYSHSEDLFDRVEAAA